MLPRNPGLVICSPCVLPVNGNLEKSTKQQSKVSGGQGPKQSLTPTLSLRLELSGLTVPPHE